MLEMDIILTTEIGFTANVIRMFESGKFWDQDISTHCGLLLLIKGHWMVAEMIYSPKKKTGLQLNSINKYMNNGFLGKKIVKISRNLVYNDPKIRNNAVRRVVDDIAKYNIKYDIKGIGGYVSKIIKQKPERYYCSEYIIAQWKFDGEDFEGGTPYDIQKDQTLLDIAKPKIH